MSLPAKHVLESDLALMAGNDLDFLSRFRVNRHLRMCAECQRKVHDFAAVRQNVSNGQDHLDLPDVQWDTLATEMRANIRLGLEAGACVGSVPGSHRYNPRLAVAFASLCLLIGFSFLFSNKPLRTPGQQQTGLSVLAATGGGLELRTGANSLTLLNHHGAVADQTVGAGGEIGARFVDNETGSVTINNVYLSE